MFEDAFGCQRLPYSLRRRVTSMKLEERENRKPRLTAKHEFLLEAVHSGIRVLQYVLTCGTQCNLQRTQVPLEKFPVSAEKR